MRPAKIALLWCGLGLLTAAGARPLFYESFDQGTGAWKGLGDEQATAVSQIRVAKQVGALEAHYRLDPDHRFGALLCPVPDGLRDARAVRFWVRTSRASLLAVVLTEKGGARYIAAFRTLVDTWQRIEMSVDRFRLAQDTNDDDGRLDLDQVNNVGLADVSMLFGQTKEQGERVLFLDEFEVVPDEAPTAYSANGKLPMLLDNFEADFIQWIPLAGTAERVQVNRGAAKSHQLEWHYKAEKGLLGVCGVAAALGQLPAKGARHLVITWASEHSRMLAVVLQEEKRGERPERRFHVITTLPASDKPQTQSFDLDKFQLEQKDRAGEPKPLDPSAVAMLMIGDLDVMTGKELDENTLRIEEVMLTGE